MAERAADNSRAGDPDPLVYLKANLVWWGFLALAALGAFLLNGAKWDDAMAGLFRFIFLVAGGGFTLVSVMDFLYEKNLNKDQG
jgi:hypothetical protein